MVLEMTIEISVIYKERPSRIILIESNIRSKPMSFSAAERPVGPRHFFKKLELSKIIVLASQAINMELSTMRG